MYGIGKAKLQTKWPGNNIGMNSTETMSARSQLTKPKNVGSEG
jgi:hypothetical protein